MCFAAIIFVTHAEILTITLQLKTVMVESRKQGQVKNALKKYLHAPDTITLVLGDTGVAGCHRSKFGTNERTKPDNAFLL